MSNQQERVVVLLGAGSVIEGTHVSTTSLTQNVIEATNTAGDLIQNIVSEYQTLFGAGQDVPDINFEDIYNIVELLEGYKKESPIKGYTPQERIFAQLTPCFANITNTEIFSVQRTIIETLNDAIYHYDTQLNEQGQYFRAFFTALDQKLKFKLDVFNLNYDTWVEQALLNYSDGFLRIPERSDLKRFNVAEYLHTNKHRVSHLHGQIYFEFPPINISVNREKDINFEEPFGTLYKYDDYQTARRYRESTVHSRDNTQNGNPINKANIVTGMLKLDKVLRHPLDLYFGELIHSLLANKRLVIVGYGFFDLYINQLLFVFNSTHLRDRKIVLIDYLPQKTLDCIVEHPFHSSQDKATFSNLMFHDDYWWDRRKRKLREDRFHYSDDNNSMLCIKGFRWTSGCVEEIIDFLNE